MVESTVAILSLRWLVGEVSSTGMGAGARFRLEEGGCCDVVAG